MAMREELRMSVLDNDNLVSEMDVEFAEEMAEFASQLILCPANISDEERIGIELRIVGIYKECIKNFPFSDMIAFSSVFEEVETYNDGIFQELAHIEYEHGPQHYAEDHMRTYLEDGYDEDDIPTDEIESFMVDDWSRYYYENYMDGFGGKALDEYVAFVLNKYRLSYSFEKYDIPYDNTYADSIMIRRKGASFIANDAQSVILPEFLNFGFAGYSDFLNYHEELDLTIGLIGLGVKKKNE